jgi:hypothetical protein
MSQEGHFAERTWAGLLSTPLTPDQVARIENVNGDNNTAATDSYFRVLEIPGQYMGTLEAKNQSILKDVDI